MNKFSHLHVHTQYSILDGAANVETLLKTTKKLGMSSIAITDHGNMYGVYDFVKKANKEEIKPIIGSEMYVAEGSRFDKKGEEVRSGYHLILLAKNKEGYKNLSKLSSSAFLEGFYYDPRIDKELLRAHSKGLIASSACLGGEIPHFILKGQIDKAEIALQEYLDIFGDDFYLEMQRHKSENKNNNETFEKQEIVNKVLIDLSKKYNVKLIATNDIHFVNRDDARAHDILVCLNTGKDIDDDRRMKYSGEEFLKSPEEMAELFSDVPEALLNTQEIVDKIEVIDLEHKIILPIFPLPDGFANQDEYLKYLTYEGAQKLYDVITDEIKERIDYELSVIFEMGFSGYFLIVQDFINEAKKIDVAVGPGRGSAAGSIIAFCTGITSIDPIKYNLLFERFLNPQRKSMPDIDIDFDDDGRGRVIDYVINKYGKEKVAQIITFGSMASKSAIKDVGRVLKLPLTETDRLSKLVPPRAKNLTEAFKESQELRDVISGNDEKSKETLSYAKILEGSIRNVGTHACGVIIGPEDLKEHVPLCKAKDTELMVTQYDGKIVESVGLLKMDFLGLKTLSIIKDTIFNIKQRHDIVIDITKIPLDDELTYELFQKGDTVGIFQFESDGMRSHLKTLKPNNIEDLIAMNALYRPGPMDFIPLYINRKHGREKVEYAHPMLEELLKPTYGIMVYQEQIMQTAQIMAGYSLGDADNLRRAMGKKKPAEMALQKEVFVKGAIVKGIEEKNAEEIFSIMERFAEYGFNRSHSAAYAVLAYQTGYLKAHYPAEFMAAVLTRNLNDLKEVTELLDECKKINIEVLGPDVNESAFKFTVINDKTIRFGLGAIKGVGEASVDEIVRERKAAGSFSNLFDITRRVNLNACNKKCLEALAMGGAFDGFKNIHRAQYFANSKDNTTNTIERAIRYGNSYQSQKDSSQHSLFGEEIGEVNIEEPIMPEVEPWPHLLKLKKEKEVTGFYLSGHPLDSYAIEIKNFTNTQISAIIEVMKNEHEAERLVNHEFVFAGIITDATTRMTKMGDLMGTMVIEDYTSNISFTLFKEDFLKNRDYFIKDILVLIKGKLQLSRNRINSDSGYEFKPRQIELLSNVFSSRVNSITIKTNINDINEDFINNIKNIAEINQGKCKMALCVIDDVNNVSVDLISKKYKVDGLLFIKNLLKEYRKLNYKLN
ncbi:MAG: DNA polymerase III subunit alpha [Bacteroidetes bacterium GWE2_29_8]|nr:MAG: DNA polymerase III subunit alpha [Bacteroidetes bacterium GWE2_29_8]